MNLDEKKKKLKQGRQQDGGVKTKGRRNTVRANQTLHTTIGSTHTAKLEELETVCAESPLYQIDCDIFRRAGMPFRLSNVTPAHESFVIAYSARYNLGFVRDGVAVTFYPLPD